MVLIDVGRGKAQRENIGKLVSIVNLGRGCALQIDDDSAIPKLLNHSKLPRLIDPIAPIDPITPLSMRKHLAVLFLLAGVFLARECRVLQLVELRNGILDILEQHICHIS